MSWYFCPECTQLRETDSPVPVCDNAFRDMGEDWKCDTRMIRIPQRVAEHIQGLHRTIEGEAADDGTWIRIRKVAFGRIKRKRDHPWFIKTWWHGKWHHTTFRSSIPAVIVSAFTGPKEIRRYEREREK